MKLLLQHGSNIYDVTPILEGGVEWFASIKGKAGRLKFKVVRDGIVNFVEGDKVTLYVNGMSRFSGFVMTKERTSEQIISVTAYDQMFYLTRNKGTYVFVNKSAKEVVQTIGADYGLQTGYISDSGWKMPQRIEEGETLVDIILSALEICGQAVGKEYFLYSWIRMPRKSTSSTMGPINIAAARKALLLSKTWQKNLMSLTLPTS